LIYFLSFLSIIGFVGVLSKKYPKLISVFPLFVCTSIILLLYLSAFIGLLFWVNKLIFFAGLASLIYCTLYVLIKNRFSPAKIFIFLKSIPSQFWFFLALGIVWFAYVQGATLHNSDEFYWAKYAKLIFYNHGLSGIYGGVIDYGVYYSPIASLNQYFYLQFGKFSEQALYFAQGILGFSALSYVMALKKINYKGNLLLILVLFSFLSYFLFSQFGFLSILVDHVIAIIFGISILVSLFTLRSIKQKLLILPILFLLSTIKENGMIFAYILAAVNLIDLCIYSRKNLKISVFNVLIILAIIATPFLAYKSWYVYLNQFNVASKFRIENISEPQGTQPQTQPIGRDKKLIATKFVKALATQRINSAFQKDSAKIESLTDNNPVMKLILKLTNTKRFPLVVWLLILFIFSFLIYKCLTKKDKGIFLLLFISLTAGFASYLVLLMAAYTYFYPLREALELTSIVRYINTYTIGYFVALIGFVIMIGDRLFRKENAKPLSILGSALLLLFIFETPPINVFYTYPSVNIELTNQLKNGLTPWINLLNGRTEEKSRTFIYTKFKDVESPILAYEIFPRKFSSEQLKRIEEPGKEDYWVSGSSSDQLRKLFATGQYDYFLVDRVGEDFWNTYGGLFEDISKAKSYRLFKIVNDTNGEPKAVPYVQ